MRSLVVFLCLFHREKDITRDYVLFIKGKNLNNADQSAKCFLSAERTAPGPAIISVKSVATSSPRPA